MARELEELPLFPLNTVLFPYAQIQLHIFEDRYRDMVRNCMEFERPFGIVLIRHGSETGSSEPYMVGTAVRIVKVHTYNDGRMDIQVVGERRFRIRDIDESQSFLVGKVEPVVELEVQESPRTMDLMTRVRESMEMLVQRLLKRQDFDVQVRFPTDPVVLSFTVANLLPLENLEKQRLLELTDTMERVEGILPILEAQIMELAEPQFRKITRADLTEWIQPN